MAKLKSEIKQIKQWIDRMTKIDKIHTDPSEISE